MSSTATTDELLTSLFSPPEFSSSFHLFFHAVRQVLRRTTKEASEQTATDLEQLDLIWCDSLPLSSSPSLPSEDQLGQGTRVERCHYPRHLVSWLASPPFFYGGHFVSLLNLSPGSSRQPPYCTCASGNGIEPLPVRSNHLIFCAFSFRVLRPLRHTAAD